MARLVNIRESRRYPRVIPIREDGYLADDETEGRKLIAKGVAALLASGDAGDHALGMKVSKLLKPEDAVDEDDEDLEEDEERDAMPPGKVLGESRRRRKRAFGLRGLTEHYQGSKRGDDSVAARLARVNRLRGR